MYASEISDLAFYTVQMFCGGQRTNMFVFPRIKKSLFSSLADSRNKVHRYMKNVYITAVNL